MKNHNIYVNYSANEKILLFKAVLILLLYLNSNSIAFSQTNGISGAYLGVFYSPKTYIDYQMEDLFHDYTSLGMDIKSFKGYYGSAFGFWTLKSDADYNIGSFTETGFYFDALVNIPINLSGSKMNIYTGPGVVYTFDAMTSNLPSFIFDTGEGFGYDLVIGYEVVISNLLGGFIQYRYIDCITEGLQVGSCGLEYGVCVFIKTSGK